MVYDKTKGLLVALFWSFLLGCNGRGETPARECVIDMRSVGRDFVFGAEIKDLDSAWSVARADDANLLGASQTEAYKSGRYKVLNKDNVYLTLSNGVLIQITVVGFSGLCFNGAKITSAAELSRDLKKDGFVLLPSEEGYREFENAAIRLMSTSDASKRHWLVISQK